ncbi:hypothetical protein NXS11_02195 [Staphylococcus sp. GRT3]|uniref:Group II intron maturase-specific domain-containing protein n=1 Tax=Staphylococcus americanisciuri TaxID=2973940 RepID=A0ABT2F1G9_9STAP|nr:hypothetical protein [Staphylococcus americanisciuri]
MGVIKNNYLIFNKHFKLDSVKNLNCVLRRLTKRNSSDVFKEIITEINQVTGGWINCFDRGIIKKNKRYYVNTDLISKV